MNIQIGGVSVVVAGVREVRKRELEIFSGLDNCSRGSRIRFDANPDDEALAEWKTKNVRWYTKLDGKGESYFAANLATRDYTGEGSTPFIDPTRADIFFQTHGCDPTVKILKGGDEKQHSLEIWCILVDNDGEVLAESNHMTIHTMGA